MNDGYEQRRPIGLRRCMQAAAGAVCTGAVALVFLGGVASTAATLNVSGTWQSTYSCNVGCAGQTFPDTIVLHQAQGSSSVTGTDSGSATLNGTLSGSLLTFTLTEGSYTANYKVTIAADGQSWSGTVTDSHGTSGTDAATLEAKPVLAQSGAASTVSGTVLVETPGGTTFEPLTSATIVPMGSTIDATNGTVALTVAAPGHKTQSGEFYDGEFTLTQAHSGLTTETLTGGSFAACSNSGGTGPSGTTASAAGAGASSKTPVRSLWGHAHGKFSTSGRGGAATVLGTIWLTEDLCDGTLFKAVKDSVTVIDFAHPKHKHIVRQGHSYLALLRGS